MRIYILSLGSRYFCDAFWCIPITAADTGPTSPLLRHAFELADLNNWSEAEPEFTKASALFRKNGDAVGLAYTNRVHSCYNPAS